MIEGLTFEAEGHMYRYKGQVVPSVTQILEPLQYLQGVPWEILEAAREFGVHVHLACHLWNSGELDEETLDPALAPYLADWKQFLSETGFFLTGSESRVFNKLHKYAGTADAFGNWKGTTWVLDIKSGVVPSTVGAQLAAYQQAASDRPRRRLCVQLTGHGYKLHEQKDLSDFSLFTSALNCYRHNQKHHPRSLEHGNRIDAFA